MNVSRDDFNWMVESVTADLVRMLVESRSFSMSKAFDIVYGSDTYKALQNPDTGLYFQSPGYVFSFLEDELRFGKMV